MLLMCIDKFMIIVRLSIFIDGDSEPIKFYCSDSGADDSERKLTVSKSQYSETVLITLLG